MPEPTAGLPAALQARLEDLIDFASAIAGRDFSARRAVSPHRDEVDALIAVLNIVAEDFGAEAELRRAAEAELHDTVEAYESAPAIFCSVDAAGRVLQCNRTMERALGWPREAILGRPLLDHYAPEGRAHGAACLAALAADARLPAGDQALVAADGRPVTALLSGSAVRGADGALVRVRLIFRDVGEERRLEAQLLQAQKMEGIGRLAGGIAHDFNNLLTAILGCGELLRPSVLPAGAEELDQLLDAARRAADLTGQLLAFSRRTIVTPRPVDLNDLLRDLDKLLRRTLGERIRVVTATEPALWTVVIDRARLEQVVLNLAINARDAMPDGGRLTLETQNVTLDDEYLRSHHGVIAGDYVLLAVSDDGVGMGPEVRERLFEPFFTTKDVGQGTGLGLAMAWGIVRQAGGTIAVYTEPGEGTTFKIYLPRATGPAPADPPRRPVEVGQGGTERVLVVEDDSLVRALLLRTLRRAGYDVSEAPDGVAALEWVRASGPVDLVITDVVMPRLGGKELADRLAEERLCRAVLFVSGYTANSIVHNGVIEEGRAFLQKPFTTAGLLAAVRRALSGG